MQKTIDRERHFLAKSFEIPTISKSVKRNVEKKKEINDLFSLSLFSFRLVLSIKVINSDSTEVDDGIER